ncbi:MAG: Ig-like domain-containing protein [Proteobacteria bacterium]|nr:Ig-like domain-containing protein [Pseudomonadota bacterium]
MKSTIILLTLLLPIVAVAEGRIVMTDADRDGLRLARQVVLPTGAAATDGLAASRTIYLNRNGVTLKVGDNDARTNTSTIVRAPVTIPPWTTDPGTWSSTVACVRDIFARFDVTVVETDPGNVPHLEAVFGGSPTALGLDATIGGISPFMADCSIIENSMVFTFTEVLPNDPRVACEIMAQEIAHSYGLDHELLASDPMTYLPYDGHRAFQDVAVACGEDTARPCGINGSTCRAMQNSVALLETRLGISTGDLEAPILGITSPANHATVPPGVQVRASASDDRVVTSAQLLVDGVPLGAVVTGAGPFVFTTPTTMPEGAHDLTIEVTDGRNLTDETIHVTVRRGAAPPTADAADGADIVGGCATGHGGAGGGTLALLALVARALSRARRPR